MDSRAGATVRPSTFPDPTLAFQYSNIPTTVVLLFTLCVVSRRAQASTGTIFGTAVGALCKQPRFLHARCARCSARLASRPATLPARPCARIASPTRPIAASPPLATSPPPPVASGVRCTVRDTIWALARRTVRAASTLSSPAHARRWAHGKCPIPYHCRELSHTHHRHVCRSSVAHSMLKGGNFCSNGESYVSGPLALKVS